MRRLRAGHSCLRGSARNPTSQPVVAVPAYKQFSHLDRTEVVSFQRLCRVLGRHPIRIFAPQGLDLSEYTQAAALLGVDCGVERFDPQFFTGIKGYNRLLLGREFYERFSKFTHVLIHQLDAYVFGDALTAWCERDFDYVGAPWVSSDKDIASSLGGNGGFSLRNVAAVLRVLSSNQPLWTTGQLVDAARHEAGSSVPVAYLRAYGKRVIGWKNTASRYANRFNANEDVFWAAVLPLSNHTFNVAPAETAIGFAFEAEPARMFRENGFRLPFGCHAWFNNDPDFWREFIEW